MKILTAGQMREVDRRTSEEAGVGSLILMENAGVNLYLALEDHFEHLEDLAIAIICGKGNNGGDGLVLARQLLQRGIESDVYLLAPKDQVSGDAAVNLAAFLKSGGEIETITGTDEWDGLHPFLGGYDIIVDAILGTGIDKPLKGLYSEVVAGINESGSFVLAVDIPSGMISDSAEASPLTVWADVTVTFTAPKVAHILNQELEAIGQLYTVPIGTPSWILDDERFFLTLMNQEEISHWIPRRPVRSHKGTYGTVSVIAGSLDKPGAAALSAYSALRAGSGLVTVLTSDKAQPVVAGFHPELMSQGLPSTAGGSIALASLPTTLEFLEKMDVAGLGPGLTTDPETVEFVNQLVKQTSIPLVIDADGLNALVDRLDDLAAGTDRPLIFTPHPGEFSRLAGIGTPEILKDPVSKARQFAQRYGVWLVLKMFRTLVATPEGHVHVSPLGNPGMATAGTGDVLTGVLTSIIGQFVAQGDDDEAAIERAICVAVFLHGSAGELAVQETGPAAMTSGDICNQLGLAYRFLQD